jgi:hypothetical protein
VLNQWFLFSGIAKLMPESDHADIREADDDADHTYTGDGVVTSANSDGQHDDSFFIIRGSSFS